ncbi:hypothetical protein F5Y04DRAFT_194399 [Hypomontagnella monticulosa]|nr:hypothetical protein F5Y04DRAFT_194399 [Hypomontagnella monticulosa]
MKDPPVLHISHLLEDKTYADIRIVCHDKEWKAHRLVLSQRSPWFKWKLEEWPEKSHIDIDECTHSQIDQIVTYIYKGEIPIYEVHDFNGLIELWKLGHYFQVADLCEIAVHKLKFNFDGAWNVIPVRSYCYRVKNRELVINRMLDNFLDSLKSVYREPIPQPLLPEASTRELYSRRSAVQILAEFYIRDIFETLSNHHAAILSRIEKEFPDFTSDVLRHILRHPLSYYIAKGTGSCFHCGCPELCGLLHEPIMGNGSNKSKDADEELDIHSWEGDFRPMCIDCMNRRLAGLMTPVVDPWALDSQTTDG